MPSLFVKKETIKMRCLLLLLPLCWSLCKVDSCNVYADYCDLEEEQQQVVLKKKTGCFEEKKCFSFPFPLLRVLLGLQIVSNFQQTTFSCFDNPIFGE